MCFEKSDTFGLISLPRSFFPSVLESIYPYRLLLLALILSILSHKSHSKEDISAISLKRLIKVIFLFKGVKSVFLIINCIKYFRLLIIRFFKVKIFKNHTLWIFLRGRTLVLLHLNGCACYTSWVILPGHVIGYVNATRPPPHGHSYPRPGHVPGHIPGHVPGYVSAPLIIGTHQGPLALKHSRRPLALWHPWPLLLFSPRPFFPRGQYPSLTMADSGLHLSAALGFYRPPIYGGLWPMGHPWPR